MTPPTIKKKYLFIVYNGEFYRAGHGKTGDWIFAVKPTKWKKWKRIGAKQALPVAEAMGISDAIERKPKLCRKKKPA